MKKVNTKLLIAVGAIIVLALLVWWLTWRGISQRRSAVEQAVANFATSDTLRVEIDLTLHLPERLEGRVRPFTEVKVAIAGDVKRSEDGTPELNGTLFGEARGSGNIFFVDGDLALLQDVVIFRLDDLPVLLNPTQSLVDRWTRVEVPVLVTNNPHEVAGAFAVLADVVSYQGKDKVNDLSVWHFSGQPSAEQEAEVADVLRQSVSGNRALHTITRLLDAHNVKEFDLFIDPNSRQLVRVQISFVHPLKDGGEFDFARLVIDFDNWGEAVEINRPETQLTVRPEVFAKLFGTGEIAPVKQ